MVLEKKSVQCVVLKNGCSAALFALLVLLFLWVACHMRKLCFCAMTVWLLNRILVYFSVKMFCFPCKMAIKTAHLFNDVLQRFVKQVVVIAHEKGDFLARVPL